MKYIRMIESCYPSLSKSEKKVADYVMLEKGNIIYETLLEISKKINVGEATILRFVKKVGFNGFQDLKLQIAKEDKPVNDSYHENYIDSITANMIKTIENTKTVLDISSLNNSIRLINDSKRIFFFGVGSSGLAAGEAQIRFLSMGKVGMAITDSRFQTMYSFLIGEDDVIIALSLSGRTKEIIETIKIAKARKIKVIAITNYALSPLAQLSDCLLLTAGKENLVDGGSLISKISQLYVIELLCAGYALLNKNNFSESKQ